MDWGRAASIGDVFRSLAAALPDKPALVGIERTLTFSDVNRRINRLCHGLGALGLRPGDRVAMLLRNRPEVVEVYGVAKAGMIGVPLNWRLTPRELVHPLQDSRPVAIVVEPAHADVVDGLRGQADSLQHFIVLGDARPGWTAYEALLQRASDAEPRTAVDPQDAAAIIYSSGTTGLPKGAVLSNRGLLHNARVAADDVLGLDAGDVGLAVMPLFHVGGMWYYLFPSLASGSTTILLPEFRAAAVLEAIRRHRVTHVHLVPTMIGALLDEPGIADVDLDRLRLIKYAASPIPLALLIRAQQVFRGCGLVQSFGSTEGGIATALSADDHARAAADSSRRSLLLSCGRALRGAQVEIRTFAGGKAKAGEVGDIVVRSDGVMQRYWNNPDETAKVLVDGWLYTGDIGYLDDDGYLYIVDRRNDMIVSGGENVYPREVEDALHENPDIAEVAVFAVPDPKWVERVAAAVVLKPGCKPSVDDICRHAATRLASYKCPKSVFFVDKLPRNATGKLLKKELRRQFDTG